MKKVSGGGIIEDTVFHMIYDQLDLSSYSITGSMV